MSLLLAGIAIFCGVHLLKAAAPATRSTDAFIRAAASSGYPASVVASSRGQKSAWGSRSRNPCFGLRGELNERRLETACVFPYHSRLISVLHVGLFADTANAADGSNRIGALL